MSKIAPGGGAVGAAVQYRMLVDAGLDRTVVVGGLTASNLLTFALVLAMPLLAIPALIRGLVPRDLVDVTLIGVAVFAVLAAAGAWCLRRDWPLTSRRPCRAARAQPPAPACRAVARAAGAAAARA